ncbi:hypothetical protein F4815DRAFT_89088 [Daldinia loculata]|nr:hypothetical protein F4815DRAFT_89088 [Daldinia loculata]
MQCFVCSVALNFSIISFGVGEFDDLEAGNGCRLAGIIHVSEALQFSSGKSVGEHGSYGALAPENAVVEGNKSLAIGHALRLS